MTCTPNFGKIVNTFHLNDNKKRHSGTNSSGFTALPGGLQVATSNSIGQSGYWWSSTESILLTYSTGSAQLYFGNAWNRNIYNSFVNRDSFGKHVGMSIRCIKD